MDLGTHTQPSRVRSWTIHWPFYCLSNAAGGEPFIKSNFINKSKYHRSSATSNVPSSTRDSWLGGWLLLSNITTPHAIPARTVRILHRPLSFVAFELIEGTRSFPKQQLLLRDNRRGDAGEDEEEDINTHTHIYWMP